MSAILPRLVLGTARLDSGASEREGVRLVRSAFDAGINHVDTAPSYGLGLAEVVVGKALSGFPEVQVTAKLGSLRPRQGYAKSWLRRLKRRLTEPHGNSHVAATLPEPGSGGGAGDFRFAALAASLTISRERLGRIDRLLLHDSPGSAVDDALLAELHRLALPLGAAPGYAVASSWNTSLDAAFPADSVAQCAFAPGWFLGEPPPASERKTIFHSVIRAGAIAATRDPSFAAQLSSASADRIATFYALAAQICPTAKLIVASSHMDRLHAVLAAIRMRDVA